MGQGVEITVRQLKQSRVDGLFFNFVGRCHVRYHHDGIPVAIISVQWAQGYYAVNQLLWKAEK